MSDNIITTATFGQTNGDKEEEPIVIAQRFLNIFRQLHIFSNERKEAFNQMLMEQPKQVLTMLKTLPGGAVLLEYLAEIKQAQKVASKAVDELASKPRQTSNSSILENAVAENQQPVTGIVKNEIINTDAFAKVLASSLAQSNAQIIRELRSNVPAEKKNTDDNSAPKVPLKLIADETFTKTIATALAGALSASEEKRRQDNKMITQSFLELQENLGRIVEQSNKMKIASDNEAEAAAASKLKSVVDDLVKAQSNFLRETTRSQKEELSSMISLAIKESMKMSTQSLIDNFKRIESNSPAPITYAASSPTNGPITTGNVEEALRAQGREFSSIISAALRESQQNSAQAIIKTLESLKGTPINSGTNAPNVEDIMKMQAALLRDITQAQSREFSNLISSALKESQQQSTQAIIAALSQMQGRTAPTADFLKSRPEIIQDTPPSEPLERSKSSATPEKTESNLSLEPEPIIAPDLDYTVTDITLPAENAEEESSANKKKKKKKKKKNQSDILDTLDMQVDTSDLLSDILSLPVEEPKAPIDAQPEIFEEPEMQFTPPEINDEAKKSPADTPKAPLEEQESKTDVKVTESVRPTRKAKTILSTLPPLPVIEDKPDEITSDWGFSSVDDFFSEKKDASALETEEAEVTEDNNSDWEWEYQEETENTPSTTNDDEEYGVEGQDWEWSYEEVPDDENIEGEEGQDWEWSYEEVSEDDDNFESDGNNAESKDNITDKEESTIESADSAQNEDKYIDYEFASSVPSLPSLQNIVENSDITLPEHFELLLIGMDDDKFHDPYLENLSNM